MRQRLAGWLVVSLGALIVLAARSPSVILEAGKPFPYDLFAPPALARSAATGALIIRRGRLGVVLLTLRLFVVVMTVFSRDFRRWLVRNLHSVSAHHDDRLTYGELAQRHDHSRWRLAQRLSYWLKQWLHVSVSNWVSLASVLQPACMIDALQYVIDFLRAGTDSHRPRRSIFLQRGESALDIDPDQIVAAVERLARGD